ncbi:hypothetical protein Nepgr_026149 [Nepenthes gracilis]|uniref:Uncharacterized protein n=1 Tax=Nepenthes gracilis TaxID=150966 RepID=A0AAD3T992_NEPGR|nr:hypothetical protein Nepgr_026149 [Nepenthes gracilis]
MAKKKNKKNKTGEAPMDITEHPATGGLQAMDTSESADPFPASNFLSRSKIKKGVQMKRSKNVRKTKATAKAISKNEKISEKLSKKDSKRMRVQSAKSLYD